MPLIWLINDELKANYLSQITNTKYLLINLNFILNFTKTPYFSKTWLKFTIDIRWVLYVLILTEQMLTHIILYFCAKLTLITNRSRYSRMDQVKFVEGSRYKKLTWSILEYLDPNIDDSLVTLTNTA